MSRWRTQLPRPVIALEMDPLGRFVIHGNATGEIIRLDLFGDGSNRKAPRKSARPATTTTAGPPARTSTGSVRVPDWEVPVVESDQEFETAVIAVVDEPHTRRPLHEPAQAPVVRHDRAATRAKAPDLIGVGRILRTAPGWLAAATDRQILLFDLRHSTHRRLDISLHELTHLAIRPDDFGLILVQERDRIGRLTTSGRWVWKQELRAAVEELAIGPYGFVAVTTHGGQLLIFDPAGESTSRFTFDLSDPPLLIEAPDDSPPNVAWVTLARHAQLLRGHDLRGNVLWERPLPWEGWALFRLGRHALANAADGRALACDGSGEIQFQSASVRRPERCVLRRFDGCPAPDLPPRRSSHFRGARWPRTLAGRRGQPLGPLAAGATGVAVMLGRSLAWFQNRPSPSD